MFDELQRALRKLEGERQVSVTIPADADGYFDRECPSERCLFGFKVHEDDWRDKVRDEEVYCPFCGHMADSGKWWTQGQLEHAKQSALSGINAEINTAMKRDAERWNGRQPRNSFIGITMNVDSKPQLVALPPAAAAPMRLKISCPNCSCRYAVIGAAFFCPACGHNAAEQAFAQTLSGIGKAFDALGSVRQAIADPDTAENTVRLVIENGLQNAVTAFQRHAESLYSRCADAPRIRRNLFQNLLEGSEAWTALTGKSYEDHLDATEMSALSRAFQQRHLLAHTQGIIDQDYISRSGDTSYRKGQRLVLRENDVRESVTLIEKLAEAMAADIAAISENKL